MRSVKKEFKKLFKKISSDCKDPKFRPITSAISKTFKKIVKNSLYNEYRFLEQRYHYTYGKEDSNKIRDQLLAIANELDDNHIFDRYYNLPLPPSKSKLSTYIQNRRQTCFDIDLTSHYNKPEGDQGKTSACFGFGAAGLLNNALALENINPLYLYILAIEKKVLPTYIPIYHDVTQLYKKTNHTDTGGVSSFVARLALSKDNYCTLNDLYNPWKDKKKDLGELISEVEEQLKSLLKNNSSNFTINNFFIKNKDLLNKLLPKMQFGEFLKLSKNYKGTSAELLRKLVLSQCKTPLPKGKSKIKVNLSLNFDSQKIDKLLNNGEIITFNHNYKRLFQSNHLGYISDHVALLTGRRWNHEKNRCEYRIVNSHGDQCSSVVQNEDVSCDSATGMWIGESFANFTHFSHEYTSGKNNTGINRQPYHPAMDPDAIE